MSNEITSSYTLQLLTLLNSLQTSENGLTQEEAEKRLASYGKNLLPEPKKVSLGKLFLKQFASFMIYILLGAVALSLFLKDYKDAILVGLVIIANAFIGFFQEYKAERTLASLKKMASPTAKVKRDGQIEEIATELLVPGDIVILEEGDIIPADMRLTESVGLSANEALLTGESAPSQKDANIKIQNKVAPGDQLNMVFMGTVIAAGNGLGVVVATGATTQMGKIAQTLAIPYEKPTPLQKNLGTLGKYLVAAGVTVSFLVFLIGYAQGRVLEELLFTVISLAVAVIPEGLVAVVTITMAVGVQRMAKRNAIVRNLPAVETLGAVNVICSDKTGTLTEGKMVATDLWVGDKLYNDKPVKELDCDLRLALTLMALCNDAVLQQDASGTWEGVGDPTEVALLALAQKLQIKKEELENTWEFIEGLPFDSERKRMSVIYHSPEKETVILTKGAPEEILNVCSFVIQNGETKKLGEKERERLKRINLDMAERGLRVLGMAQRQVAVLTDDVEPATIEKDMVFLGLVGVLDPARPEAKQAVLECKRAGIGVIMVTGDHPATAQNVATQLGIFVPGQDQVMTGEQMDKMTESQLCQVKPFPAIFARVSPENKLTLVNSLRKMKYVVAMTGDGVNDAPAIKHANVGIAMGKHGTDVTKQAADIVLADDNFATIVAAIKEGRRIFTNLQKFIRYLLSCNMSTVFSIFFTTTAGVPLPFTPIQILWLNLVTDSPPALALGFDEAEKDSMKDPPRNTKKGIFRKTDMIFILYHGLIMAALMLAVFFTELYLQNETLEKARTMAFAMLVLVQLAQAFNAKSAGMTLFRRDIFRSRGLVVAVLFSFSLLLVGMYLPFLSGVFEQVELYPQDWLELGVGVAAFIMCAELFKLFRRKLYPFYSGLQLS